MEEMDLTKEYDAVMWHLDSAKHRKDLTDASCLVFRLKARLALIDIELASMKKIIAELLPHLRWEVALRAGSTSPLTRPRLIEIISELEGGNR